MTSPPVHRSHEETALVLHRANDAFLDKRHSLYAAAHIPGARYIEATPRGQIADETEQFLTGVRRPIRTDRVLATVLFTDVVGSTGLAVQLGDRRWRALLARHDAQRKRDCVLVADRLAARIEETRGHRKTDRDIGNIARARPVELRRDAAARAQVYIINRATACCSSLMRPRVWRGPKLTGRRF